LEKRSFSGTCYSPAVSKRTKLLIYLFTTAFCLPAFPWGDQGHQTIAAVAYQHLSPNAKQKVDQILAGEDITVAAVWPDKIRGGIHPGPLANTPEGKSFNSRFKHNSLWHFVDLPLASTKYGKNQDFISDDDVVHALGHCIDVLEGKSSDMSKREALRWVLHLAGDTHQPMHAASGYFLFDDQNDPHLFIKPADILNQHIKSNDDKGANRLRYTATEKLHHYWDTVLVGNIVGGNGDLKARIETVLSQSHFKNTGGYRKWPANWITASAHVARQAYDGIDFQEKKPDGSDWFISIQFPPDYKQKQVLVAADQLAKAAFNLAALLNKIKWQ
jgi:hypothetical protein